MGCRLVTGRYVLGVLYRENRPKSENWATLTSRSFSTVRPTKILRVNSETPWTTTWRKQYLFAVHPVTCALSEVPVWPTFDFRFWVQMTPNVKFFENVFPDSSTGYRITFHDQIWWKSAVAKLPEGRLDYHAKKTWALRDSSQHPFCPKWADRAQSSLNVVTPWHVHVYWIWSGSAAFCRTYSGKIFFGPKSQYNIGFQPTITPLIHRLTASDI